ncbi:MULTISPECIES: hypothetical protein [unclassified Chryseobacterium]|uniref:hypothetical protein n=1 Tax=unclassified Chryseobacterium TaxID=2593645 RepID=UPI00226AB190|nr:MULTISPECIES: hypothetical protein [unclassified Chryseobacterium]
MKKTVLLAAGVIGLTLMSFADTKNTDIIEVNGNVVTVKNTEKISKADLEFLSKTLVGWSYCDYQSEQSTCTTKNRTFPDEPTTPVLTDINKIINKYQ